MAAVRLDSEELEAMAGLTDHAFRLYVVLRRFMDYRTGLVGGPQRRISLQSLREEMYVEPGRGIQDSGSPTKSKLRRTFQALERANLVADRSDGRNLVFELRLATTDSSASGKPDTNPTQTRHRHADTEADTEADTHEPAQKRDPREEADTEADTEPGTNPTQPYPPEPDTPPGPGSGNPTTPHHRARVVDLPADHVPASVQEWVEVMTNLAGYAHHQAWSRKAVPMYQRWIEAGVTVGDLRDCVASAWGQKGELPAPTYFDGMAVDMHREKQAPGGRVVPLSAGGPAGGGNHGTGGQRNQPGSAFERVMAGAQRAYERGDFDDG